MKEFGGSEDLERELSPEKEEFQRAMLISLFEYIINKKYGVGFMDELAAVESQMVDEEGTAPELNPLDARVKAIHDFINTPGLYEDVEAVEQKVLSAKTIPEMIAIAKSKEIDVDIDDKDMEMVEQRAMEIMERNSKLRERYKE